MTAILCHFDSYLKEFDAKITEINNRGIVLDRTAFYAGGGGQPPDTGVICSNDIEYKVESISRLNGKVIHNVGGEPPAVNSDVHGLIDWERRYKLMRTHTALHILCGVVWRDYGARVTGCDMKPLLGRMDFELEQMSGDFAREIETRVNEEVSGARPINIEMISREHASKIPDLIRTKINLLPEAIREVRTVNIVGLDLQADGGTHVANTKEVGKIIVTGHESKGRVNKRLRIKVL